MHFHVINEGMETPAEQNIVDENRERAEWLFESYMYSAASCRIEVQALSRWDWKVQNPVTKEWVRVAIDECTEVH